MSPGERKKVIFVVVVCTDLYIFLNFWYKHLQFVSSSALSKGILAFRVLERKCMPFIERERTFSRKEAIPLGPESTPQGRQIFTL